MGIFFKNPVEIIPFTLGPSAADAAENNQWTERMPYGGKIVDIRAQTDFDNPPTGSAMTFDVLLESGGTFSSILATEVTIDAGESTSVTSAVPYAFNPGDDAFTDNQPVRVVLTGVGTTNPGREPSLYLYVIRS